MKKNKISKNWIAKRKKDSFFKESQIQGYRSRSAFKLLEMNEKFKFLNKNTHLLDLGASPGGWSQVASQKISNGKIIALDIQDMKKIYNVDFFKGNICDAEIHKKILSSFNKKIDVVISDMAANTSGNKNLDSYKTGELCLIAMDLALKILTKNGVFISKVFMGSIFEEINKKAKNCFSKVARYKPSSSKAESKEIYIFCKGIINV